MEAIVNTVGGQIQFYPVYIERYPMSLSSRFVV